MRLPVATDLKTRLGSTTKDARMVNALVEQKSDGMNIRKRPGMLATGWDFTSAQGLGLGLNGLAALVYSDTFELIDVGSPIVAIHIGDLYGGYYAMVDNPSTSPGAGDAYWSISAPGADRFRGFWAAEPSSGTIATSPTTPGYLIGDIAGSAAAAAKVWVEKVIGANLAGIAALDVDNTWDPDVVAGTYIFNTPTVYTYNAGTGTITMNVNGKVAFLSPVYPGGWPSGASWATPSTYDDLVGKVRKLRTTTSFTVTASGTTATITAALLTFSTIPYHWIKIAGCAEPEYNGTFYAVRPLDPTSPWLSPVEGAFTLPGVPAASPATGVKSLEYYGPL